GRFGGQELGPAHERGPPGRGPAAGQEAAAADEFAQGPRPEPGDELPRLFGDAQQVGAGVLRPAAVFALPARDARRAVGDVALLADDAADGDHQPLAEAEFVRAEQAIFDDIVAVLDAAADPQPDAAA